MKNGVLTTSAVFSLALTEMRLILAKMLWVYDMELTNLHEMDWEQDCKANPLWRKAPLIVRYKKRKEIEIPVMDGEK